MTSYIILGRKQREAVIIGQEKDEGKAHTLARDSVFSGRVAEAHVIQSLGSYLESSVNRANPDTDTSLAEATSEASPASEKPDASSAGLNVGNAVKGATKEGSGTAKPEVTQAQAVGAVEVKEAEKKAAVPKQ